MTRLLVFIVLVFALAAGFAWLADHPGSLALTFGGYEVRTSVMVAAVLTVALVAVVALVWLVVRGVWRSPQRLGHYVAGRRRDRGWQAVSRGMVAIGSGDARAAARYANESRQYLGGEPLTLLLAAQAAQLAGDRSAAAEAFTAMLRHEETRILGLRGLYVEARRRNDDAEARRFAEEAAREKPGIAWAGNALLDYQAAEGDWSSALATLSTLSTEKVVEKPRAQRLQAVLLTARAMELEPGDPGSARSLAMEAHRLAPELVPAAVVASRLASRLGDPRRAGKVIEASWRIEPHPELASAYLDSRPGDSTRDRLRRMKSLTRIRANHPEGLLALARAAIDARDWRLARDTLHGLIATHPTERACLLMAAIEEGEHQDIGRARDWYSRAVNAPRDPAWMADGYVFDAWAPVSPVSGRIDAFEWKAPVERLGGPALEAMPPETPRLPGEVAEATPEPQPAAVAALAAAASAGAMADESLEDDEPADAASWTGVGSAHGDAVVAPDRSDAERNAAALQAAAVVQRAAGLPPEPAPKPLDREPPRPAEPTVADSDEPLPPSPSTSLAVDPEPAPVRPALDEFSSTEVVERKPPASAEANGSDTARPPVLANGAGEPEEEIAIPRPPDDPGPEPDADPDARPRRFRLFS